MSHVSYIQLQSTDMPTPLRFSFIQQGFSRQIDKGQSEEHTITGGRDFTMGGIYKNTTGVARVRHAEDRDDYGTLDDLAGLFMLNNPGGVVSNILRYIDHFGNEWDALLIGRFQENLLSAEIEGTEAHFVVQINLAIIGPHEGGSNYMNTIKYNIIRVTHANRPVNNSADTEGRLCYETDTRSWWRDNGATWDENPFPAGFIINPMEAEGDMIVGGVEGVPSVLLPGAEGSFLMTVGGVPTWVLP
jgi:hypothetical protein